MKKPEDVIREFELGMSRMPEWFQDWYGGNTFWDMMLSNGLQVFGVGLAEYLQAVRKHHIPEGVTAKQVLNPLGGPGHTLHKLPGRVLGFAHKSNFTAVP